MKGRQTDFHGSSENTESRVKLKYFILIIVRENGATVANEGKCHIYRGQVQHKEGKCHKYRGQVQHKEGECNE